MARPRRQNTTRLLFNPACPNKTLHMVKKKKKNDVTRSGRKSNKPKILSPTLKGTTYTDGSRDRLCDAPMRFETDIIKTNYDLSDCYKKDTSRKVCPFKKAINTFCSESVTTPYANACVLDGKLSRSTNELLRNENIIHVDIPNCSTKTSTHLQNKFKGHDKVSVHQMTDYEFFKKHVNSQYELIYLDRCGWYVLPKSTNGTKDVVELIVKQNQLAPGGVIGITVGNT